ncbi:DUF2059 domain-containing protein [Roseobacter sp. YSTF-M11]|uniref:DUF2059 domain-containing protein n=1 Tax=Roseobacter insulae TaxID=2859783 RepID=A0A9X1FV27_9RHOB|nr:DUF2059 domain-containing protein [Roseobacter insulae]MBW4708261.1 DUF2059 domain-containing protein [Roseobacter insulae]
MRVLALVIVLCGAAMPAWADARITVLMDAMRIPELTDVIRLEGLQDAEGLNADMLAGQGGALWHNQVERLYDPSRMQDLLYLALQQGLDDAALDGCVAFFDTQRGQTITELEIAARKAMLDEAVQDAAAETYRELSKDKDPHAGLVAAFVEANDLLELNVAITMSSSFQFYQGLADGRLLEMSESDILKDVWASENRLREESKDWINGYFLLAYQPLDLPDLEAYLAFSRSPAGVALNAALFAGYEDVFREVAYGLGRAVALNASGNDI